MEPKMEISIRAKNAFTGEMVDLRYTVEKCEHMGDYVAHTYAMGSVYGAGRFDSMEEAMSHVLELTRKRGFEL